MSFIDWMHETHRVAEQPLKAATAAAEQGDAQVCAPAAKEAAFFYLRRYLEAVAPEQQRTCDSVTDLLEAAAGRDRYFDRLRAQAKLLDAGPESGADAETIVDALKEIRLLAMGRAGKALGFSVQSLARGECDPRLAVLVTHSTTVERASSIFAHHALFSFNQCVRRGLLSGEPIGQTYLLDPRRCADFVGFGAVSNYHAGEKVANSQRKGWVDEALEDDYQPSVRLFFRKVEVESLPGFDDDGLHQFLVRDEVALDLMVCTVFPSEHAKDGALAGVREAERRQWLAARCLTAPPECCADPQTYVRVTNETVAKFLL